MQIKKQTDKHRPTIYKGGNMSSIALFPCSFSSSSQLTEEMANSFGLTIYDDRKLIHDTAAKYNVEEDSLSESLYKKTSVFNQFTLEREKNLNLLKAVLAEKIQENGPTLYSGFQAILIPETIPHILKVLVVDNKTNRTNRAIESGLTEKEAKKFIRADDVRAYNLTDFLFKKEAYDSSLYDLVIPVEYRSAAEINDQIRKYYQSTPVLKTTNAIQAGADFKLATEVEHKLLLKGHKIPVKSEEGVITLSIEKSVLNFNKLRDELIEIASTVVGVTRVEVEKSPEYEVSIYRQQKFELPSKVLFVDDEKEFVQTVSERLISRDVGTYGVYNGDDALELVAEDRPEVMVLDLKMPGMHGVEVLRRTKELAPEVEVIILTGHGTKDDMRQCMELGAFAYLNKPVNIEELSATIQDANQAAKSKKVS